MTVVDAPQIRTAFHSANVGVQVLEPADGVIPVELESTAERIGAWGGAIGLYRHFLAAALTASEDRATPDVIRSIGVIAGWRSGVLGLRIDALARASALNTSGDPATAAAALGLPVEHLAVFLAEHALDPFSWPTADHTVATLGGFIGLGGRWTAPPRNAQTIAPSSFTIDSAGERWLVEADVFGSRLSRLDSEGRLEPLPATGTRPVARAVTYDESYFVTIERLP